MPASMRFLGCVVTLAAMFTPWVEVVRTAVHLTFEAHHEHELSAHDDLHDPARVVHGHDHDLGTPAHSHDATLVPASRQVPVPGPTLHPSVTAVTGWAPDSHVAVRDRFDLSPPLRVPLVLLRI